jgi:hypothetical protein
MIFRGGRFSLAVKARRSWQIRVPMGGTLHRDRINTRRSLSTTRQENRERREQPVECRATTAVLCIEGIWRKRNFRDMTLRTQNMRPQVGFFGSTRQYVWVFFFPLRGSDPWVIWNKINKLLRFGICDYLRHITRLFATRYSTKISMVQGNPIIYPKHTSEWRFVPMAY